MDKLPELIVIPLRNGIMLDYDYLGDSSPSNYKFEENFRENFLRQKNLALFNLGLSNKNLMTSRSLKYLYNLSHTFLLGLVQIPDLDDIREKATVALREDKREYFLNAAPFFENTHFVNAGWVNTLWGFLNDGYKEAVRDIKGSIQDYLYKKNKTLANTGRVCFHLVENKIDPKMFAFLATFQIYDIESSRVKNISLEKTLKQYLKDEAQLLKVLGPISAVAGESPLIKRLLESGEIFYPLSFDKDETYEFLTEIPQYEKSGIICRVPNWWKKKYKTKIDVSVGNKKSYLGFDELADFSVELHLGNLRITIEDLEEILKFGVGLIRYKGEWVEVDPDKLLKLKEAYLQVQDKLERSGMTLFSALKLELSEVKDMADTDTVIEISRGQWIKDTLENIATQSNLKGLRMKKDFKAILRPYQATGVDWLYTMKALGLGCCLADDMGLGKTIQVLGWLNATKDKGEKTLLIIPASLIGNWISEIKKFTPALKYYVFHPGYNGGILDEAGIGSYNIIITTYGMVGKEKLFTELCWDNIILDEAQAIKNPTTKQSKNIRNLKGKYRIALTGTPVENRLMDLWSIFDFLNKGLLGSNKEFKTYDKDMDAYDKLRRQVRPFILRRLKTDKSIISDLPDKVETKSYAALYEKQLALYNEVLDSLKEKLESSDGIARRGLIIQSIMKFKQICNHPSQYLGLEEYPPEESGKFALLEDICQSIALSRERALIFTQFREITPYLHVFLTNIFRMAGLVITGDTPVKKRKEIVDAFQGDKYIPYILITVKAGGVGLNLTKANHVIHFDRWWNPAVENQATDRAFRIGQTKNVIVHKFITQNTVEEKIDAMIMDKVELAGSIIGDNSEVTITNMTNEEIINLFRIGAS